MSMTVHQCARFWNNPRLLHESAVKRIAKYLASTSAYGDLPDWNRRLTTCGVVYKPDIEKSIECYVYAIFVSGWAQADAVNAENIMSHTGYVIMHTWCTILWCSKLQTEIYLSATKWEYVALIQEMCKVIPFISLMKEVSFIFDIHIQNPEVLCKLFKNNQVCIAVAESKNSHQEQNISPLSIIIY